MIAFLRNLFALKKRRERIADRILKCAQGVNLSRTTFHYDGVVVKNAEGETKFYSATEIDKIFANLNTLMKQLRS